MHRALFVLPIALFAMACGSSDDSSGGAGECNAGEHVDCACSDGSTGSQGCGDDGSFGVCDCATGTPVDMPSMGGMPGIGGMPAMGGSVGVGGAPPMAADLGVGDGSDIVLIGDSWMNLNGVEGLQQSLIAASGQPYRAYGVPGTRLLNGQIPGQYDQARAENPDIKTLVVSGGGNDILQDPLVLGDCLNVGPSCQARVDEIGAFYQSMSQRALDDGIQDVVIIMYTRGTALGAGIIDYVWQTLGPMCENAPVDCHMVDADEAVDGIMQTRDGIHPIGPHYDALGQYVHETMQAEGMRR